MNRLVTGLVLSLRRIAAMVRKEFRQLLRDRLTLGFIVGIPALQLTLFGYAINLDVRHIPTAVVDQARSALSRKIVSELEATQTFRVEARVASPAAAIRLLEAGKVGAAILIPPELDRNLRRGRGAEVGILADASNPTLASAVALSGQGFGASLAARMQPFRTGSEATTPQLLPDERTTQGPERELVHPEPARVAVIPFYNPERRTPVFIVPGLVGVILTMTMMLMTALAIVRERERGTFEFLIATPVRRIEVMVGKIVPYLVVGHVQVAVILTLGAFLFDVPMRGSFFDLGVGALPFLAAMLTMGLVVSSLARTQFQATQMSFFFFLPSMLLSGFMFPFEAMPEPAQWIGQLLPLTHFLRIVRSVLVKGAPIGVLLPEVAAILGFFAIALALAVTTFRKRLG
ncbi:MAG TPA: ABC transporter permease [Myxococcota bacterium]|jgi:ABC-2 type transport system permease protein|nr:ABC transporter permease [Myxococcota bacterium]